MFDPNKTIVTDLAEIVGHSRVATATESQERPKVPSLEKRKVVAAHGVHECYLDVEGNQEVFFRGGYVTHIPLQGGDVLVGRRDVMAGYYPDVDLTMYRKQDPSISRRHLRFYRDADNVWYVEDLSGHNVTFVNNYDSPLNNDCCPLENGDRIIVASSIALVFREV